MKKILCLFLFALLSNVLLAQQGTWYMGGVAGISSKTNKDAADVKTVNSNWVFGPEVGTFLKDDIQLGLVLGIGGSSQEQAGADVSESSYLNPTLYGRKFFKITDNFSTFAGIYLNYISGTTTDHLTGGDIDTDHSGFGARLGVGVAYALSPRFGIVGQYGLLGWQSVDYEVDGHDAGSESSFDFGMNTVGAGDLVQGNGSGSVFNIGIYYTFITK
jgi:hypothetical protein